MKPLCNDERAVTGVALQCKSRLMDGCLSHHGTFGRTAGFRLSRLHLQCDSCCFGKGLVHPTVAHG